MKTQTTWSLIWDEKHWKPPVAHAGDAKALAYSKQGHHLVEVWHNDQCRFILDSWLLDEEKSLNNVRRLDMADTDVDALEARPEKPAEDKDKKKAGEDKQKNASMIPHEPVTAKDLQKKLVGLMKGTGITTYSKDLPGKIDKNVATITSSLYNSNLSPNGPVYDVSAAGQFMRFTAGMSASICNSGMQH